MTIVNNSSNSAPMNQAIYQAKQVFEMQQTCFKQQPYPTEKLRKHQLRALKKGLLKFQDKLLKAVSADFGHRAADETRLADILPCVLTIDYTLKHLRSWMKPEKRQVAGIFQPAQARVMRQPLGVVGIVSSWSYPVLLALTSVTAAIAAGNRVMLKPSELTPYTNRVLNEILAYAFSTDEVCMIEGDASVAEHFTQLPFDHLLFTGSSTVGKRVMATAANNLTPVTLELGGKSPAVIAPDVAIDFAVERILFGKCLNAGQSCVAPDYVLCPEEKMTQVVAEFQRQFVKLYPDLNRGDYTAVINDQHYSRLTNWLQEAQNRGAQVTALAESCELHPRIMPLQLITGVEPSMQLMQHEIFGPLLPIIGYQDLKQAMQQLYALPRPLAMYLFSHNSRLVDQVLRHSHAGGVCVNDCLSQVAQTDLPFGGVGASGMGSYHAKEGFTTFSHNKALFKRGKINPSKKLLPPFGRWLHKLVAARYLS